MGIRPSPPSPPSPHPANTIHPIIHLIPSSISLIKNWVIIMRPIDLISILRNKLFDSPELKCNSGRIIRKLLLLLEQPSPAHHLTSLEFLSELVGPTLPQVWDDSCLEDCPAEDWPKCWLTPINKGPGRGTVPQTIIPDIRLNFDLWDPAWC